jgi:hypothetical protein
MYDVEVWIILSLSERSASILIFLLYARFPLILLFNQAIRRSTLLCRWAPKQQ